MKSMLIAALAVALLTGSVCAWGVAYVDEATDELSDMALQLMHHAESEEYERAQDTVTAMANLWARRRPVLEMLTDHDDLHSVTEHIVEGRIHLKYRHANDFYQSMALLDESLRHIRDSESFSLANLL